MHNLKVLKLEQVAIVTPNDWIDLFDQRNLRDLLDLKLTRCSGITNKVLETISRNCALLQHLNLDLNSNVTEISNLQYLHSLKVLKLKFAKDISPDEWISLFSNKNLEDLKELELIKCEGITNEVIDLMALNCSFLESLFLCITTPPSSVEDQSLIFLMKNCRNIQKLSLKGLGKE